MRITKGCINRPSYSVKQLSHIGCVELNSSLPPPRPQVPSLVYTLCKYVSDMSVHMGPLLLLLSLSDYRVNFN